MSPPDWNDYWVGSPLDVVYVLGIVCTRTRIYIFLYTGASNNFVGDIEVSDQASMSQWHCPHPALSADVGRHINTKSRPVRVQVQASDKWYLDNCHSSETAHYNICAFKAAIQLILALTEPHTVCTVCMYHEFSKVSALLSHEIAEKDTSTSENETGGEKGRIHYSQTKTGGCNSRHNSASCTNKQTPSRLPRSVMSLVTYSYCRIGCLLEGQSQSKGDLLLASTTNYCNPLTSEYGLLNYSMGKANDNTRDNIAEQKSIR